MATQYWIGATNAAWNTATNWSLSQDGPADGAVPVANDTVYLNKNKATAFNINVNVSIANAPATIYVSKGAGTNGVYTLAGVNTSTAGTAWTLTNAVTIDVAASDDALAFKNSITGGGTITKTGLGGFGSDAIAATTWGTSPIALQAGYLFYGAANNKLGSGKITMSADTQIMNMSASTAYTLANPLDVRGNVKLNADQVSGRGAMTFTAAVDLDSTKRTLDVGGTLTTRNDSAVGMSGVISGTAGFKLIGDGYLAVTGLSNTISGTVTFDGGYLLLGSGASPTTTGNLLPSITSFDLTSTGANAAYVDIRTNAAFSIPQSLTGDGVLQILCTAASGVTVPSSKVGSFTGVLSALAVGNTTYVNAETLDNFSIQFAMTANNSRPIVTFTGTSATTPAGTTTIYTGSVLTGCIGTFRNNGSAFVQLQSITGTGSASAVTLELAGTNADPNEVLGVISNGTASSVGVTKIESGTWNLTGNNTYTGATTLTLGTLVLWVGSALGSSASTAATTLTAGTLQIRGAITINKASSAWALNGSTIENVSGANTITAASWTIATAQTILITAGSLDVTNAIAGTSARSLAKTGTGTLKLTNTSSGYLGTVTVSAGELQVASLANAGAACSLGTQAAAQATITMGGNTTLSHIGTTADTTDRGIAHNGAAATNLTINSSGTGSGAVTLGSGGTIVFGTSGVHTLIFGGTNTATNTCARALGDASGGGAVSVTKNGSNNWSLTGAITATGVFTQNAGTLDFGAANRTLSGGLTVNGGTVSIANGNTIDADTTMTGGEITAVLTGGNGVTVTAAATESSPAVLRPDATTTGSNSFSGGAAISGCVDLVTPDAVNVATATYGLVLGIGSVNVNSTGIIRTASSNASNQRGRARYNNLTFQSGSVLKLGYAE